jgi:hypothetical protein
MPSWRTPLPCLPEGRHVDALPSNNCVHGQQTVQQPLLGNSIVHTFFHLQRENTQSWEKHFLCFPFWGFMTRASSSIETVTCVEAVSNTFTAALLVVWGDENGIKCLGYSWIILFLRCMNTGTWPSRFWEFWIWDGKMWLWVARDSEPRMTVLARTISNCNRQTRLPIREGATSKTWQ